MGKIDNFKKQMNSNCTTECYNYIGCKTDLDRVEKENKELKAEIEKLKAELSGTIIWI